MFLNRYLIFITFSSLFYLNSCQSLFQNQVDIKKLQSFVKCVSDKIQKNEIQNIPPEIVLSLLVTSQQKDYKKLQEIFTKHFEQISDCLAGNIPKMPDGTSVIDINTIFKNKYDWANFITCLMGKINDIENSPFKKLIDYINEGKYMDALREEFKLRNNGNMILKSCMTTKIQSLINKNK